MAHKHTLTKGKEAFFNYYFPLFPNLDLERYLSRSNAPVLMFSPEHESELITKWQSSHLTWQPLPWYPYALYWPKEVPIGTSLPGYTEGWLYSLNPASLIPVLALNPQADDAVLDACAAPGGKTLAMLNLMHTAYPKLVANDSSGPRFKRLRTILKLFGYPHIETRNFPAQTLGRLGLSFDKILLDAPCSSEKHVFNSKHDLKLWSPKRISILSNQQEKLITSLLKLLNPQGQLVYSTCALTPTENESVIAKVLFAHPNVKLITPPNLPLRSPGLSGYGLSDPDYPKVVRINENSLGLDPMFIAVLSRQD